MSQNSQKSNFWQALGIAWELGYVIAIPIVVFALGGRFLDQKLHTSPWLLLTGIVLSIILSSIGLVWKFKKLMKNIEVTNKSQPPAPTKQ